MALLVYHQQPPESKVSGRSKEGIIQGPRRGPSAGAAIPWRQGTIRPSWLERYPPFSSPSCDTPPVAEAPKLAGGGGFFSVGRANSGPGSLCVRDNRKILVSATESIVPTGGLRWRLDASTRVGVGAVVDETPRCKDETPQEL
jgi:hypothetical protein